MAPWRCRARCSARRSMADGQSWTESVLACELAAALDAIIIKRLFARTASMIIIIDSSNNRHTATDVSSAFDLPIASALGTAHSAICVGAITCQASRPDRTTTRLPLVAIVSDETRNSADYKCFLSIFMSFDKHFASPSAGLAIEWESESC